MSPSWLREGRRKDQAVSRDLVIAAYRQLLGREPESEQVIELYMQKAATPEELLGFLLQSDEYAHKLEQLLLNKLVWNPELSVKANPFSGCSAGDLALIRKYFSREVQPEAGFVTDRLGVRTRASSLWKDAQHLSGAVLPPPIPADFHAGAVEWVGLLKAVDSAEDSLRVLELGAGWGPWVVAAGVAARNSGITDIVLAAVEADPEHFQFLRQHLSDNGFDPDKQRLFQAAVGVERGRAHWPVLDSRNDWGSRPIPMTPIDDQGPAIDYLGREFVETLSVEVLPFEELLRLEERWNLVHVDVQGEEAKICRAAIERLNERVHWLAIGTHSRSVEAALLELLSTADWELENESPVYFKFRRGAPTLEALAVNDGTQVWRNPRLDSIKEPH